MTTALLSIFGLALVQPLLKFLDRRFTGWLLALLPFFLTLYFWGFRKSVAGGEVLKESFNWVPAISLNLSFFLDGLSLTFVLLVTGIGALILIFAGAYLEKHRDQTYFFSVLLLFMGSMLGMVLADNLILLFVFWELTSFFSYLLIGFHHEREAAREAALQAFVITTLGGLSMLAGVILLGEVVGSYELTEILTRREAIQGSPFYPVLLGLFALGSFTKSAQIPFHFWLPGAMQAPTPVSAYLHSATMVNAGVYLMARLFPVFGGTDLWFWLLVPVGALTMLYGAFAALFKNDLKLILAYSTISVLGMLFFQLGVGTPEAISGMLLLLFAHALYKSALFLVAGTVDHEEGTRDIRTLSGLAKKLPITAAAAGLACFSYAGLPPLFGFWAKESLYASQMNGGGITPYLLATFFTKMLLFASAILVGIYPFWRRFERGKATFETTGLSFYLPPLCLALAGFWLGLFPHFVTETLLAPAVSLMTGKEIFIKAGNYHLGKELVLSLLTFAGGILLFRLRLWEKSKAFNLDHLAHISPKRFYERGFEKFRAFALWLTDLIQNGYLRFYLFVMFLAVLLILVPPYFEMAGEVVFDFSAVRLLEWALVFLIVIASLATIFVRNFLFAILAMSVVGLGMILIFALNSAPDVAITTALVEAMTLVLLVLLISNLPRYSVVSGKWTRLRDGVLSAAFGCLITAVLMKAKDIHLFHSISDFYTENALRLGHGRNVVNVILVDFRGLDTLGEITVLAVAGVSVYSLIKLKIKS